MYQYILKRTLVPDTCWEQTPTTRRMSGRLWFKATVACSQQGLWTKRAHSIFFFNWRCSCSQDEIESCLDKRHTYVYKAKNKYSNSQWKTEQTQSNLGKSINNSQLWKVSRLMPNSKAIFLLRPLDTESLCAAVPLKDLNLLKSK